jgi:hypothetical protein
MGDMLGLIVMTLTGLFIGFLIGLMVADGW